MGIDETPARAVPRGIEVLVRKAAVDAEFRRLLLGSRAGAAEGIGLVLHPAEAAMLDAVPASQLEAIIAGTRVSPGLRRTFLTGAAAAMLAALGPTAAGCTRVIVMEGSRKERAPASRTSPAPEKELTKDERARAILRRLTAEERAKAAKDRPEGGAAEGDAPDRWAPINAGSR